MRRISMISASMAAVMAVTSVETIGFASLAQAKSAPSRPSFKPQTQRFTPRVFKQPRLIQKQILQKQILQKPNFKAVNKTIPYVLKGSAKSTVQQQFLARKNLPLFKPTPALGLQKSRLALPQNLQPKLTLIKAPKIVFVPRFAPFLQRHWKSAFFWVAVAGIGYITIPELYYDRWVAYVDEDEPDYDSALGLLSLAALDEEEGITRVTKPADVPYRYSATVPPTKVASTRDTTDPNAKADPSVKAEPIELASCSLNPFVDRQWTQPYAWVQIPEVGNVTVPEQTYDRFVSFVSSAPPNYTNACTVLAEAAAAETVGPAEAASSIN